jgi:hypothetical protein
MNGRIDAERILDAYLAPEADRLPDRVLDAALADIARTPQRRAIRVPWRFPTMPVLSRMTGIAAVALVAVVGAGALMYLNSTSGTGGPPTNPPTTAATPQPTLPPGISGWKTYTSPVYGYTISYPDDWSVADRATKKWQPGESEDAPVTDVFTNSGDDIAFFALQFPAPTGADLGSWDGLRAALTEMCAKPAEFYHSPCPSEGVTPMCLGSTGCQPVAFVHEEGDQPRALFGDPGTGIVTYLQVGREDDFPAAAPYGGTVMLLKSILGELGVREPRPDEIPN